MNINLQTTLFGGQAFNWDYIDHKYYGFTHNGLIIIDNGKITQINENIDMDEYLGNHLDYESIKKEINKDTHIDKAIKHIKNITILKQDFLLTTTSYILATNKNIPSIRKSIRVLSKMYGTSISGTGLYTFPAPQSLALATIEDLKRASIGYRAPYLKETSKLLTDLQLPKKKEDVRKVLISMPGIGPKVADCILLYSLGYLDTVPIDRWMYNIAKDIYLVPYTKNEDISKWYTEYFGKYAGIAGQYLFEYYRIK